MNFSSRNSYWPWQAGQSRRGAGLSSLTVPFQRSIVIKLRLVLAPTSILIASVACSAPMTAGTVPTMPAVSQVGVVSGSGSRGEMQRRQGGWPGITVMVMPWEAITPP